ncbi:MAG: hypothetical protein IH617_13290 [Hydrogenophaga sp.]|nr:hypothetical protein [Hydrogenophaga sp.]
MTKRTTSTSGSTSKGTAEQHGEAVPTPRQVAAYRMARICLIEWADLYAVMLEEKRHNWAQYPERAAWIESEVTRLKVQLQALKVGDLAGNIQVARDYDAFLRGNVAEVKP